MRYVFNIFFLVVLIAHQTRGQKHQGYIDYNKVVETFPQYRFEQEKIEIRTKELTDSLKILVESFQHKSNVHLPQKAKDDSVFRKRIEDEVNGMVKKLQEFHERAKEQINHLQEKRDLNMKRAVTIELKKFSVDRNVICVMDKNSILYCNVCSDFSDEFIDYCKSKRK